MRGSRGFSTLEAMVAVAVLAVALVPMLQLQSQIARTHARYIQLYERTTLQRDALAVLRDLNPMADPQGRVLLNPGVTLAWTATALTTPTRSTAYPNGDGPFEVALYRVDAEIIQTAPAIDHKFALQRLGWHRVVGVNSNEFVPGQPPPIAYP